MFEALVDNPDFEYLIVDSTIVHATSTPAAQKKGSRIRPGRFKLGSNGASGVDEVQHGRQPLLRMR